jgi:hypothetical protein
MSAERRRRARRRRRVRLFLPLLAIAVVFARGVAVGEALHDNPAPGGTQTLVRTLKPLQLEPAPTPPATTTTANP